MIYNIYHSKTPQHYNMYDHNNNKFINENINGNNLLIEREDDLLNNDVIFDHTLNEFRNNYELINEEENLEDEYNVSKKIDK